MTTSCKQCNAPLPVATSGTGRCPACRRGFSSPRDEHSILFSLASVSTPTPTVSATPLRSRTDEGSGLIDIRAMHPALGGRVEPAPPRFTKQAPALFPAASAPVLHHATRPALPSQMPLYGLVAALMFGLASLTAFVLSEPPPASARHTTPAPVVLAHAEREPGPAAEVAEPKPPVAELEAPTVLAEPGEPERPRKTSRRGPTTPTPVLVKPQATVTPVAVVPEAKPAARDDDATMKCLLGGAGCEVDRPAAKPEPVSAPMAEASLPERLSDTDITAGTGPAKARATSSCARLAKGDERVRIKLSIAGPTGTVIRAAAEDDAGNPALAACCVGQLESASFKPVQRAQMGALVTLKF